MPVDSIALDQSGTTPLPAVDVLCEAVEALEDGGQADRALAAWLQLRPPSALAAEAAWAAMLARAIDASPIGRPKSQAIDLVRSLVRLTLAKLESCKEGELLASLPAFLDATETYNPEFSDNQTTTRLFSPRKVDQGWESVAGSPTPASLEQEEPPRDSRVHDWLYHRSSFKLGRDGFGELLSRAYIIPESPQKIEFAAIDAMREAYRAFTEAARTVADRWKIPSYPSMESVDAEIAKVESNEGYDIYDNPEEVMAWTPFVTLPLGPSIGSPRGFCFLLAGGTNRFLGVVHPGAPFSNSYSTAFALTAANSGRIELQIERSNSNPLWWARMPSTVAVDEGLGALQEGWLFESSRKTRPQDSFAYAKSKLLRIVQAIGDIRINTDKVTVRQFVDWAAEATTLSHASMLALALEVARIPGSGAARFVGAQAAQKTWQELAPKGWTRERFFKAVAKTAGTLAELAALG